MAYVRRTDALVALVERKVLNMMDEELVRVHKREDIDIGTPLYDDVRVAVEGVLWKPAPELMDKMPKEWCRHEDSMSTSFKIDAGFKSVRYTLESPTDDPLKLPPNASRWDTIDVEESDMTPLIKEWVTRRLATEVKRDETVDLFGSIGTQLRDYLLSHASLNTALKEMPELEMYIPQDILDKVSEKVVRAKKEKEDVVDKLGIDVDALTRAAVAHRLTMGDS